MSVKKNLTELKKQLPEGVTLVAVSKTKPAEMIMEAYETGHRDFGENYVQELIQKQSLLPADIRWHFIGHLQSNKVKYIVPFVHLIHGIDSLKLLREVNKQAAKVNRVVQVLLQLYIASEETKFGLSFEECEALLADKEVQELKNVQVRGFMAMASNTSDLEKVGREFLSVKNFAERLRPAYPFLEILSYGMSGDYKTAITCGSNLVRVGSLIFGSRQYN